MLLFFVAVLFFGEDDDIKTWRLVLEATKPVRKPLFTCSAYLLKNYKEKNANEE